ncbi:hypothetical protein KW867_33020, partial [Pseudomonas aeruginosa]|nr:hypothetical protein [Pseudomonas aeruginosa]
VEPDEVVARRDMLVNFTDEVLEDGSGRGAVRRHPPQGRGVACSGLPLRTGRLTRRALFDPASAPLACSVPASADQRLALR